MNGDSRTEFQKRVGVGERARFALRHRGTSRVRPTLIEEGKRAGQVGGHHTDHWDGRVDATPQPRPIRVKAFSQSED